MGIIHLFLYLDAVYAKFNDNALSITNKQTFITLVSMIYFKGLNVTLTCDIITSTYILLLFSIVISLRYNQDMFRVF